MDERFNLFLQVIESFDQGYDYTSEYDAVPHKYGDEILYQSEMHLLKEVGKAEQITVTELAGIMKKTKSACSQMVHKLRKKGFLEQERNEKNLREYILTLTDRGKEIYNLHTNFEKKCLQRSCKYLNEFSDDDLRLYIRIQNKLNEAFAKDVEDNFELYDRIVQNGS